MMKEGKKPRIPKVKCGLCGHPTRATKIKPVLFVSRREGVDHYNVNACPRCHKREMNERKKGEVSFQHEEVKPTKTEDVQYNPWPSQISSDKKPKGYIHERKIQELIPKHLQEHGKAIIDANRLTGMGKGMLGAELMKIVRELTGGNAIKVSVKAIRFEYEVKHTKAFEVVEQ